MKSKQSLLNIDDIESLGWKLFKGSTFIYKGCSLRIVPELDQFVIRQATGHTGFIGAIRNKKELVTLMEQLNIQNETI